MWNAEIETLGSDSAQRVLLNDNNNPLQFNDVILLLRNNSNFRTFFGELLGRAPFDAFFWELPPVTIVSSKSDFEFVLVDAPTLKNALPDKQAFAQYWTDDAQQVVEFSNIGGDAQLIVPCPEQQNLSCYAHLAEFCRKASATQRDAFWHQVGESITQRLSGTPVWISTSGLGVYWLHVRLDSYPKYYTHKPYRQMKIT